MAYPPCPRPLFLDAGKILAADTPDEISGHFKEGDFEDALIKTTRGDHPD